MPAERRYGMDQDHYSWSPIVSRAPLRWPGNARVAFAVIVNLEHWDWREPAIDPAHLPTGGVFPGGLGLWTGGYPFPDIASYGNREYGNRVGIFRLLEVLDRHSIVPTFALDKMMADNYPELVAEGIDRKAEFIAHGLTRRQLLNIGMSEDDERQYIASSIDAVTAATGVRPRGWLSPEYQETTRTPNLLAAAGITYVCDFVNDEQPYRMTPDTGELTSIGGSLYLDDNWIHMNGRRPIDKVSLLWRDWFDGLYEEGKSSGRMMILNLHPWVIGQPWRIRHLNDVLAHIGSRQGVWKATTGQILDHFKTQVPAA